MHMAFRIEDVSINYTHQFIERTLQAMQLALQAYLHHMQQT